MLFRSHWATGKAPLHRMRGKENAQVSPQRADAQASPRPAPPWCTPCCVVLSSVSEEAWKLAPQRNCVWSTDRCLLGHQHELACLTHDLVPLDLGSCQRPGASVTQHHILGSLEQQGLVFSQIWRPSPLGRLGQVCSRLPSGGGSGPWPHPLLAFYGSLELSWRLWADRKSTRLNSSHTLASRMPSSA